MKRLILHIILLSAFVLPLQAQHDYYPFKVDLGVLVGDVTDHNIGLMAPYIEPKFNINNSLSVGLRVEYVFYSKAEFIEFNPNDPYLSDFDSDGWTFSVVPTCDYYFNDYFVRPFIGLGAGIYTMYNAKQNSYLNFNEYELALGYVPRIGFNIGLFRIACEYNIIWSEVANLNYLSLKFGYEIGGGKKWF